jgi:dTDP-4-dehydrorhamnose reductase
MKIGITGASGMLGTALIDQLAEHYEIFATARSQGITIGTTHWDCFDLTDLQKLDNWLTTIRPDVVIHCAAMVDVDACEENEELSVKLHVKTTEVIANYLDKSNGQMIYISTDSVFDGDKKSPYIESDTPNPLNQYAKTKLFGERPVLQMKNGFVLRTNIIGWSRTNKISFAEWLLKGLIEQKTLTLFKDVFISPLHVTDLSMIINKIIKNKLSGLYHLSSQDSLSKYELGIMMAEVFGLTTKNIIAISVDDLGFEAKRPKNMVLLNKKITKCLEYDFPNIRDAVNLMKIQYESGWLKFPENSHSRI